MVKPKIDIALLKDLSQKSPYRWLLDTFVDWFFILATLVAMIALDNIIIYVLGVLIIGNRQHALAILGHDAAHKTLSKNSRFNDFLSNALTFWPLGLTTSGYRALHWEHHRHTGTDKDPELAHKKSRAPQWDLPTKPLKVLWYSLCDIFGGSLMDFYIIVKFSKPDAKSEYLFLFLFHFCVNAFLIYSGLWLVSVIWYYCLPTTFMMFFRLRLWLEHQGTTSTHRLHLNWYEGILLAPHYGWLHWEHHNWPSVPYYRLKKLREETPQVPVINLKQLTKLYKLCEPIESGNVRA